jgi:hypothetical protein
MYYCSKIHQKPSTFTTNSQAQIHTNPNSRKSSQLEASIHRQNHRIMHRITIHSPNADLLLCSSHVSMLQFSSSRIQTKKERAATVSESREIREKKSKQEQRDRTSLLRLETARRRIEIKDGEKDQIERGIQAFSSDSTANNATQDLSLYSTRLSLAFRKLRSRIRLCGGGCMMFLKTGSSG